MFKRILTAMLLTGLLSVASLGQDKKVPTPNVSPSGVAHVTSYIVLGVTFVTEGSPTTALLIDSDTIMCRQIVETKLKHFEKTSTTDVKAKLTPEEAKAVITAFAGLELDTLKTRDLAAGEAEPKRFAVIHAVASGQSFTYACTLDDKDNAEKSNVTAFLKVFLKLADRLK